ncbi:hypothetical protein SDJN02_21962, partial [Cucurbita argyrosperma subsp. argyrosperma]
STHRDLHSSKSAAVNALSSPAEFTSGFPSTLRISGLNSDGKPGGPAFVGQVFSMCDLSGTGLMAVSTHFDIPFISKRFPSHLLSLRLTVIVFSFGTPEWLKKMFSTITKSERNGPMFRFFTDLGDAVMCIMQEKPHLFQFIPNEKQVKAANKLLKCLSQNGGIKKIDGVPVFSAHNLNIAIATTDGIKWYRQREIVDDNSAADVLEEMSDSILEPPVVQEVMDEMGNPGIPLSVISKVAEMQLLYTVDKVILGNRWLRKAVGIQPKFPYMVDSFERRSATSLLRISESAKQDEELQYYSSSPLNIQDNRQANQEIKQQSINPFRNLWSKQHERDDIRHECTNQNVQASPFPPKITMVGVSTGESGDTSKANLKKTMEDLTRELENIDQGNPASPNEYEFKNEVLWFSTVGS